MWAEEILRRCDALADISESPSHLTRTYLTAEHAKANKLVAAWMKDAGMTARVDAVGNLIGRYDGRQAGAASIVVGSHLDTVRNAGKYDGMLGVITGIACVERLRREGARPARPIEVVGFANEEGTRFGATMTGSRALAGRLATSDLDTADAAGITLRSALNTFGLDAGRTAEAARKPGDLTAYVELHIEQGPVLEQHGLPIGIVTAISGATRRRIELVGVAGHAGTVPMGQRRDTLAAAAEIIGFIERRCSGAPGLVGTVGWIETNPGALNVIPGATGLSVDIRAPEDTLRLAAVADVEAEISAIARRRGIDATIVPLYDSPSVPCTPKLTQALQRAAAAEGAATMHLPSGAGHDAAALHAITDVAMLFVRCTAGISHNPLEAVRAEDVEIAARVFHRFISGLADDI